MNIKSDKCVRFKDYFNCQRSFSSSNPRKFMIKKPKLSYQTRDNSRIQRNLRKNQKFDQEPVLAQSSKQRSSTWNKILDPQQPFLQKWNKVFVFSCILAVSIDPLFFYAPVVDSSSFCLSLDRRLEIAACVLRSCIDFFYVYHIFLQFRTGFIAPSSRVLGRGEQVQDPKAIAIRYLRSYFIIDVVSVLPLPQMVILMLTSKTNVPVSLATKELLEIVIFAQYIPRLWRMYPLCREVNQTSGIFTETAWAGAAFNLFLYMLASHIIGAFWYMFALERKDTCWRRACRENGCDVNDLYCSGGERRGNTSFLRSYCQLVESNGAANTNTSLNFDFGIFLDALQSQVADHENFPRKFFYCFWWGLRNLSSLGQNLKTSEFVPEILFAIFISVTGLVLFSLLIGNMQRYLQSITLRVEEMRVKRNDAEKWMSHRMLPEDLRIRIRRYEQYRWQETRGVEEQSLIRSLPKDLRRDLKRHLCWSLLMRVPMFKEMDEQLLDALCERSNPILYTENSIIFREGDPVDEMLFIMRGKILTVTTGGGRRGFFNYAELEAGDFCGDELLTWALDPNSSPSLPLSTRTVKVVKDVEAFSLMSEDLKFVASQFRRLHSKQLQHTFRFYSQQWRMWAAMYIQAAWRRYCRRKIEKALREAEENAAAMVDGDNLMILSATIYASRFADNMLNKLRGSTLLPPLLQKPADPDFSDDDEQPS